MEKEKQPYVCPAEYAGSLDNPLRKLVHNRKAVVMIARFKHLHFLPFYFLHFSHSNLPFTH
jgi:hypothetical protein